MGWLFYANLGLTVVILIMILIGRALDVPKKILIGLALLVVGSQIDNIGCLMPTSCIAVALMLLGFFIMCVGVCMVWGPVLTLWQKSS